MYYTTPLRGFGSEESTEQSIEENAAIPMDDLILDDLAPESPAAAAPSRSEEVVREEITSAEWMIPVALATQIFSIVPGIAGGLAGFVLAQKLSNAKSVKATEVLMASGTVALITFMSVFFVKTIDEFE